MRDDDDDVGILWDEDGATVTHGGLIGRGLTLSAAHEDLRKQIAAHNEDMALDDALWDYEHDR